MERIIIHLASLLLMLLAASPVGAEIRWLEKDYDFGLMKEEGGPQTGRSRFVNAGADTISIFSVKPSCGCTSASFSDEPLAPGDTALVSYTYDPEKRPGKFDKTVRMRLSDGSGHTIRIKGNVLGTPESLAMLYPVDAGEMRLSQSSVTAREVIFGRSPVFFLNAYSIPLDSISPTLTVDTNALVIAPSKLKAGPGEVLTFSINFDSRKLGEYGPVQIPMEFIANPAAENPQPVTVWFKAFVLPDTTGLLAKQGGRNPHCAISPDPLDLGAEIGDRPIHTELEIENRGNGPLHLLRVCSNVADIKTGKLPKEIKPGKKARIKLEIDPRTLPTDLFRFPLYVISDDPDHPHQSVAVTGSRRPSE